MCSYVLSFSCPSVKFTDFAKFPVDGFKNLFSVLRIRN